MSYKDLMQEKHKVREPYQRTPLEHSAYSLSEIKQDDYSGLLKEINRKRSGCLMNIVKVMVFIIIAGIVIGALLAMSGG